MEEVTLTTLALPWNMQMRGGYFFARFGRVNPQCLHLWNFVNAPLSHSRFLSEEHFSGTGVEWTVLLPLPWYSMVIVEAMSTDASTGFRSATFGKADENLSGKTDSLDDLAYVTRFENFFELTKDWSLLIGNSAAFGQSSTPGDDRAALFGSDLTLKWSKGERAFRWNTEGVLRQSQIPSASAQDFGGYSSADFQFTRQWVLESEGIMRTTWPEGTPQSRCLEGERREVHSHSRSSQRIFPKCVSRGTCCRPNLQTSSPMAGFTGGGDRRCARST